jgi:LmbE family N-acetylglucosaminyl deacetylase
MKTGLTSRYSGGTVLAIGAHPDDIELGVGGTIAWLKQQGTRVIMAVGCVPSDYEKRVAESQRAAEILGGELTILFNHGCSRIEDQKTYEVVRKIDDLILQYKPTALFSHGSADFHRDHQMIYDACHASQRLGWLDFFCYYPTSCRPVPVKFQPHAYIDVTQTMDKKMEALRAFPSQLAERGLDIEFIRDMAREQGRMAGMGYAEAVEVVRVRLN